MAPCAQGWSRKGGPPSLPLKARSLSEVGALPPPRATPVVSSSGGVFRLSTPERMGRGVAPASSSASRATIRGSPAASAEAERDGSVVLLELCESASQEQSPLRPILRGRLTTNSQSSPIPQSYPEDVLFFSRLQEGAHGEERLEPRSGKEEHHLHARGSLSRMRFALLSGVERGEGEPAQQEREQESYPLQRHVPQTHAHQQQPQGSCEEHHDPHPTDGELLPKLSEEQEEKQLGEGRDPGDAPAGETSPQRLDAHPLHFQRRLWPHATNLSPQPRQRSPHVSSQVDPSSDHDNLSGSPMLIPLGGTAGSPVTPRSPQPLVRRSLLGSATAVSAGRAFLPLPSSKVNISPGRAVKRARQHEP